LQGHVKNVVSPAAGFYGNVVKAMLIVLVYPEKMERFGVDRREMKGLCSVQRLAISIAPTDRDLVDFGVGKQVDVNVDLNGVWRVLPEVDVAAAKVSGMEGCGE